MWDLINLPSLAVPLPWQFFFLQVYLRCTVRAAACVSDALTLTVLRVPKTQPIGVGGPQEVACRTFQE
jgi:hypothetical protein